MAEPLCNQRPLAIGPPDNRDGCAPVCRRHRRGKAIICTPQSSSFKRIVNRALVTGAAVDIANFWPRT